MENTTYSNCRHPTSDYTRNQTYLPQVPGASFDFSAVSMNTGNGTTSIRQQPTHTLTSNIQSLLRTGLRSHRASVRSFTHISTSTRLSSAVLTYRAMSTMTQTAPAASSSTAAPLSTIELNGYDEEQVRLMEERCILVNEKDEAYGEGSKKQCEWGSVSFSFSSRIIKLTTCCLRPFDGEYQHWTPASSFLGLPLQALGRTIAVAEKSR